MVTQSSRKEVDGHQYSGSHPTARKEEANDHLRHNDFSSDTITQLPSPPTEVLGEDTQPNQPPGRKRITLTPFFLLFNEYVGLARILFSN